MFHEETQATPQMPAVPSEGSTVPPRTAFVLGAVTGILSVGTFGFILLMYAVLRS